MTAEPMLGQVIRENKELREDLRKLITLLTKDDRDKVLEDRRKEALRLLETLKDLRDKQARARARTEMGKNDAKDPGKDQKKITEQTKDLRDKLDKPSKDPELAKQMDAVKKPVAEAKPNGAALFEGDAIATSNAIENLWLREGQSFENSTQR